MPTPVRVRGKPGNKRLMVASHNNASTYDSLPTTRTTRISRLEQLPTELLHEVLWQSLNLDLEVCSPILARRFNDLALRRLLIYRGFFKCSWSTKSHPREIFSKELELEVSYPDHDGSLWLNEELRFRLQYSILRKPWFTTRFLRACQMEYLQELVPIALLQIVGISCETNRPNRSLARKLLKGTAPKWYQDLLQLRCLGDKYNVITQETVFPNTCIPSHYEWTIKTESARHILQVLFEAPSFRIRVPDKPNYIVYEIPARIFDVARWTMEDVELLIMMKECMRPWEISSVASITAFSDGLMTAIQQKHVPAVFVLSQPLLHTSVHWEHTTHDSRFEREIANEIQNRSNPSRGTTWMREWRFERWWLPLLPTYLESKDEPIPHNPTTREHLIAAMKLATSKTADHDSYDIFRMTALSLAIDMINNRADFPEELLQEIQQLALNDSLPRKRGFGKLCYHFFLRVTRQFWRSRRYQRLETLPGCGPLPGLDDDEL